jgi:hypothetical protein
LFAEGFGKNDTPTAAGKESPFEAPAIEQKRPNRAGCRAFQPHQKSMLQFCKAQRLF